MIAIIFMLIGGLIGLKWFKLKYANLNSTFQTICIAALIFTMGVNLGSRPDFFHEILTLGWQSILFAVIPMVCSVFVVYLLSEKFLKQHKGKKMKLHKSPK